jgi:hypothetical protein
MAAQDPPNVGNEVHGENAQSPAARAAFLLVITALDVCLFVLLASGLIKSDSFTFLLQVVTALVAGSGVFAAGKTWFSELFKTLPNQPWFPAVAVVLFIVLGLANLSRLPLVPLYPQLDPDTTLKVDDDSGPRSVPISVSFRPHTFTVTPANDASGKARHYDIGYKELLAAIFTKYTDRWSPLYAAEIKTLDAMVDVEIQKTDGDFDAQFRNSVEVTHRHHTFKPKPGANDIFIWQGGDNELGSVDTVYLPPGNYTFTARKQGCQPQAIPRQVNEKDQPVIDFESLCDHD